MMVYIYFFFFFDDDDGVLHNNTIDHHSCSHVHDVEHLADSSGHYIEYQHLHH